MRLLFCLSHAVWTVCPLRNVRIGTGVLWSKRTNIQRLTGDEGVRQGCGRQMR